MTLPADWLDQLRAAYPKRRGDQGWGAVRRLVPRAVADGATFDQLLTGAKHYAKHCDREGLTGTPMIKQAATYFGRDCWWEEWQVPQLTPAEVAEERRWADLQKRAEALGFKEVDRSRGLSVAEHAIRMAEDARKTNVVQLPQIRRVS